MASIAPQPPVADTSLPWDSYVADPVAALAEARATLGDTFAVQAPDTTYLFVFSAAGVKAFYDVAEESASKGLADFRMLARKVPPELFFTRRTLPHELFGRDDVARYREMLELAIDSELDALDARGDQTGTGAFEMDAFELSRRIGHRSGLNSWGGPWLTESPDYAQLTAALDKLDPSEAFVYPERVAGTTEAQHRQSQDALDEATGVIVAAAEEQATHGDGGSGAFGEILGRWSDVPTDEAMKGAALDLIVLHLASMSNLFAATGWLLVHLLQHPEQLKAAREDAALLERCALESVRLAQRSIMLREVLKPITVNDGVTEWQLAPGTTLATLLPLTNTSSAPGFEQWDPSRWRKRRLADVSQLAARELVTAFGHGSHTCPAQPFSLWSMCRTATKLFERFDVEPLFTSAEPVQGQIGGVARSQSPCVIRGIAASRG